MGVFLDSCSLPTLNSNLFLCIGQRSCHNCINFQKLFRFDLSKLSSPKTYSHCIGVYIFNDQVRLI